MSRRPGQVTRITEGASHIAEESDPTGATAGMAGDVVWLLGSGYAAQVAMLVVSLSLRRVLGPAPMGFVALAQLVASYAPFLTLGVAQAAEREIAIEIGRKRPNVAEGLEGAAAVLALAFGAVAAAGALLTSGWTERSESAATIVAAGAIVFAQQLSVWATIRLRTRYQFRRLGIWSAFGSVSAITLTLLGAIIGGLPWALAGLVAGSFLQAAVLARAARLRRPHFSTVSFRRLAPLAPGFLAVGLSAVALNSVDQIAVASLLGPAALGLYSTAYLGNAFLVRVPNLIGSVIYPRLQRDLGAHGDIPRLYSIVRRTTEATLVAIGPLIAIMCVCLPLLVRLVLPAFVSAIPPMRLLLVGVAGLAIAVPASQMLVTIDRLWRQVAFTTIVGLGMAMSYVLAWVMGAMSIGTAALMDLIAYSLYGVILQVTASKAAGSHTDWLIRPFAVIAVPLMTLIACATVWDARVVGTDLVPAVIGACVQALAFGATWLVLARSYVASRPTLANDLRTVRDDVLGRLRWPR
ncbi:MAG: lipopolysaccharide biosynthesis protein [Candidatus Limnocylindrales bacterium]